MRDDDVDDRSPLMGSVGAIQEIGGKPRKRKKVEPIGFIHFKDPEPRAKKKRPVKKRGKKK